MRRQFTLFQSHLDLAHGYWKRCVELGDTVIDATCGNGHDAQALSELVGSEGRVVVFDVQSKAIEATKERVATSTALIEFVHGCHSALAKHVAPESVRLVAFNLGYLPGGDKAKTTQVETTLEAMQAAIDVLLPGGLLSVTCYPGHEEGAAEEVAILDWARSLSPSAYSVCHHSWNNRRKAPSLLVIQKALT